MRKQVDTLCQAHVTTSTWGLRLSSRISFL